EAAMERLAVYFDQVAALLTRTYRPISSLWTPRPGAFGCGSGCRMVEIILREHQLACLEAAVPSGSVEQSDLGAGQYLAGAHVPGALQQPTAADPRKQLATLGFQNHETVGVELNRHQVPRRDSPDARLVLCEGQTAAVARMPVAGHFPNTHDLVSRQPAVLEPVSD